MARTFLGGIACAILSVGCGHATHVRPTPAKALDVEAELGGPLATLGSAPIELPLSTVGASYGIADGLDLSGHVHLTPLFFGVFGLDLGSTYRVLDQRDAIPALALTGRLYGFSDVPGCKDPSASCGTETNHGARAYGELTGAASWLLENQFLLYVGASGLAQFAGGPPLFSVQAGLQVQFTHLALQLEVRWYEPNYNTTATVVNWMSIGGQGAWGIVLGVRYRLGGER